MPLPKKALFIAFTSLERRAALTKPSPVDPAKIKVPTLVLQGERDGSMEVVADRMQFFQQLGSPGKWFTFLPGVGKYAPIERTRSKFDQTLLSFLDQTP